MVWRPEHHRSGAKPCGPVQRLGRLMGRCTAMLLVPRSHPKSLQLKNTEHRHPNKDHQAREIGGSGADLGPSCAAPYAHEEHQVPRDVDSEHQHREPCGRASRKKHQGKQCGEQTDEAPAENAPEPEGTAKRQATTPELADPRYLRPPADARANNTSSSVDLKSGKHSDHQGWPVHLCAASGNDHGTMCVIYRRRSVVIIARSDPRTLRLN
jgi:hypothetical protein